MDVIKYPVIGFSEGKILQAFHDEDELTNCTPLSLKNGYYNNLLLIDSDGNEITLIGAEKIGNSTPFLGFGYKHSSWDGGRAFFLRLIKVKPSLGKVSKIDIEEFKRRIEKGIDSDRSLAAGWNIKELKGKVKESKSFSEIIEFF